MQDNKHWAQEGDTWALYFTPFYEEEKIAEVFCDEDGDWCFSSAKLRKSEEYLGSNFLEDAKRDVERAIKDHFEGERDYYNAMLERFKGEQNERNIYLPILRK